MSVLWNLSLVPFTDPNGDPYAGAKAYFFDAGTTTPKATYEDAGNGIVHDHPVIANAAGQFAPVFIPTGHYRLRIETASGTTLWDVDNIPVPNTEAPSDPGSGDVDGDLLFQTGDLKHRYGVGAHDGFVRCNGRLIGDASSGATERANPDCENLFKYLWTADDTLTVSGGRGATAQGDWDAGKTIELPDFRERPLAGLGGMGAGIIGLIDAGFVDNGEDTDTLGATVGAGTVTITEAQMPSHDHDSGSLSTSASGSHRHTSITTNIGGPSAGSGIVNTNGGQSSTLDAMTNTAGNHTHGISGSTGDTGGGEAHLNVQPTAFTTIYIKL